VTDDIVKDFDLAAADAQDEAVLVIKHPTTDKPTTWLWTFYGPGHPKTVTIADQAARAALRSLHDQKQARINGKKYKVEEQSLEELRAESVDSIVARLKEFTPVNFGSEIISFTPDKARELLLDRKKGWLYNQVIEFLKADENFIQPSAKS
jgi:hypothetical protein